MMHGLTNLKFTPLRVRPFVRQSGTGAGFSQSASISTCQYHSAIAPNTFTQLSPIPYNLSKWQRR